MPLTADRAKPAVPVRRHLPAHRLRAVQRRQLRLPQGRRADAVQVAQPRPAHHQDLADVDAARQLRHAGAGAAARRQELVPRQRRRDLPEPQPHARRAARHRRRRRRRPRLPHGLRADGRAAHRDRRRRARSPPSASRSRSPTSSASSRSTTPTRARSRAFLEKPNDRQGPAGHPRRGARLDGQLRLRRRRAGRRGDHATPTARAPSTTWAATSCPTSSSRGEALRLRLQGQRRARRHRARPRLLARRRDHRLLLRRAHGPHLGPPGLQPLQLRVADLHRPRPLPAGQVRARPAATASARRSTRRSPPACVVSGAHVDDSVLSPRVHRCTATPSVSDSVLLDGVEVGRHAAIRRAIIDKNVVVPEGARSGSTTSTTGPAAST